MLCVKNENTYENLKIAAVCRLLYLSRDIFFTGYNDVSRYCFVFTYQHVLSVYYIIIVTILCYHHTDYFSTACNSVMFV